MTSIEITGTIFCCLLVGALAGMGLRGIIPQHPLDSDTRDLIKLGVGLIGTMSALVLGLLVASTKGSYDRKRNELAQMAGNAILLDRVLTHYGADATDIRDALHSAIASMVGSDRGEESSGTTWRSSARRSRSHLRHDPKSCSAHRCSACPLQAQAESLAINLGQTRWLLFAQSGTSISTPFLVIAVFWLTMLYLSFGLFATGNATAFITLSISALSVAGAMCLIHDLDHPFSGFMQIPDTPLRNALAIVGK